MDDRAAEIEAVMDAVGFENAAVFGLSEGGPPPSSSRQNDRSARGR